MQTQHAVKQRIVSLTASVNTPTRRKNKSQIPVSGGNANFLHRINKGSIADQTFLNVSLLVGKHY